MDMTTSRHARLDRCKLVENKSQVNSSSSDALGLSETRGHGSRLPPTLPAAIELEGSV